MNHNLVELVLRYSFVLQMNKTIQHIFILSILLLLNSGKLFSHTILIEVNQNNITQNKIIPFKFVEDYKLLYSVKSPAKDVHEKRTVLQDDREEEELNGKTSIKGIEKKRYTPSIYTLQSCISFSQKNKSLSFCNDIITIHPYESLYLLFEVLRL